MRAAKDMKDMVAKARISGNLLGPGVTDDPYDEHYSNSLLDTSQSSKQLGAFTTNPRQSIGGGTALAPPLSGDLQQRLRKLQELSSTDKDVIEALQKKINMQKSEYEGLHSKYQGLLRNYEGVAQFAANDKAEFNKLRNGRESAEKEAAELKKQVVILESQTNEMRPQLETMALQINEWKNKNDAKVREIEKLKEELKRKEKGFDDKLNIANCTYIS
jgi:DNA repair exonuclease SbcCD ATPase subunit